MRNHLAAFNWPNLIYFYWSITLAVLSSEQLKTNLLFLLKETFTIAFVWAVNWLNLSFVVKSFKLHSQTRSYPCFDPDVKY